MDSKFKDKFPSVQKIRVKDMEIELHAPDILLTVETRYDIYEGFSSKDDKHTRFDRWVKLCVKAVAMSANCNDDEAKLLIQYSGGVYGEFTNIALELCGYQVPIQEKNDNPLSS